MAELFQLPRTVPLSNSGVLIPGAKAYFYQAGTSTLQAVYTDSDLTVPHTNPVVADGFGVFDAIWLDETKAYKVTIANAADSVLYTEDNYVQRTANFTGAQVGAALWPQTTAESTAGVTPSNLLYEPGNAKRYGATGDGVTNDATALATWLACGEKKLVLPSGTYLTNTALSLADNSGVGTIRGEGMPIIKRSGAVTTLFTVFADHKLVISNIQFDGNQTSLAPVADPTLYTDLAVLSTVTVADNTIANDFMLTVESCYFYDSPGSCIAGAGLQSTMVQGCKFEEWLDHAVYSSGDDGLARGLGGSLNVDGNIFWMTGTVSNGAVKCRNNIKEWQVSNNVFNIGDEVAIAVEWGDGTTGADVHPLGVSVEGNTGVCGIFAQILGEVNSTQDTAQFLFADNNMRCSDRAFYLGDSASATFSGHLVINGGSYQNTSGAFKAFLDCRFLDNANSETSIVVDGVKGKDFAVQQGAFSKHFVVKSCTWDGTYAAWFQYVGEDDTTVKTVIVEDNTFLNAAAGQGRCDFAVHDNSTLIIRNNHYDTDGIACQLRDFPELVIFEGNTCLDNVGVVFANTLTARASADGTLILRNNKMISTTGASVNARLIDENTASGSTVLLDNYTVYCMDNFFKDSTNGISCIGTGVTGFAGATVFYAYNNYGAGSSFSNQYPAANQSSFLPRLQGIQEYAISNETEDRTFDADTVAVAELADIVATLIKDLGHGA